MAVKVSNDEDRYNFSRHQETSIMCGAHDIIRDLVVVLIIANIG